MTNRIDTSRLAAFDVHVHLEHPGGDTEADRKAAEYFKGGAPREGGAMADYYRARNMAFIVFTVDETLSGMKRFSNDEVVEFAQKTPDVAIPFASINPMRGPEAVREAKRLVSAGLVKGQRRFFLQQGNVSVRITTTKGAGRRQPDDASADDEDV